jgi:hypothetical protein
MTDLHRDRAREELERQLRRDVNCIPIERFGRALANAERDHLAGCARCQAELALWKNFVDLDPIPSEDAATAWVAAEVQRRRAASRLGSTATTRASGWTRHSTGAVFLAAASVLLAAVVGYVSWDPEPRLSDPPLAEQVYRTASIQALAPTADVDVAPKAFTWVAHDAAVRYDVRVFEVDGTTLWTASSSVARLDLPAAVSSQFVPGKTVLWTVTAHDSGGTQVAASGTQRFRVNIHPSSRRD